jgi:hypothetical protein
MSRYFARSVLIAVVGLAISAAAFGRALHNAVRVAPVATVQPASPVQVAPTPVRTEPLSEQAVALAVQNDPFREQRSPGERYRLPGDEPEFVPVAREEPRVEPPPFSVIGTLAAGEAGYAVIQMEDGSRRVTALGESVQGYRLVGVRANTAVVSRAESNFTLRVPEANPSPVDPRANRRGRGDDNGRGRNSNNNGRNGELQAEAAARLQEALMSIRGRGAGGAVFERIEGAVGGVEIRVRGGGGGDVIDIVETLPIPLPPGLAPPARRGGGGDAATVRRGGGGGGADAPPRSNDDGA